MKYGILGTGNVAQIIATKLIELGHEVMMGSRTATNEIAIQWANEHGGNTYIGFKINYSPDAHRLEEFIKHLETITKDNFPDIV